MHHYPPPPVKGVPHKDAPFKVKRAFLKLCPLSAILFLLGACGVDEGIADDLCDLYRITNVVNAWAPDFNPVCDNWKNVRFASELGKRFGINADTVIANFKFGDMPGWKRFPNDDMIFVQQPIPSSLDELRAIVGGLHKSFFGKRNDPDTTIMLGPSTSPIGMLHAGTFPLLKSINDDGSKVYQCIYDCSNEANLIVVKASDYKITVQRNQEPLGFDDYDMTIKFPAFKKQQSSTTRPMNKMIIDKLMFKATRVKYTSLLCLRHYLAHWPEAFLCWIDLSPRAAPPQHLSSCLLEQTVPLFLQQCLHVVF